MGTDRDWMILLSISWNKPNGAPGQGGRVWVQPFPLSATEADVYTWAINTLRASIGLDDNQSLTVLEYRAVPNVPPGYVPA